MGKDVANLGITAKTKTAIRVNILVLSLIALLVMGVAAAFFRHRRIEPGTHPTPPAEITDASLIIRNFHHEASENGQTRWTLTAASASLDAAAQTARLERLTLVFSLENGETLKATADEGILQIKTHHLAAAGHILAQSPRFTLKTQRLNYAHDSRILHIETPVAITSPSFAVTAGSMRYHLDTGVLTAEKGVKGTIGHYPGPTTFDTDETDIATH